MFKKLFTLVGFLFALVLGNSGVVISKEEDSCKALRLADGTKPCPDKGTFGSKRA